MKKKKYPVANIGSASMLVIFMILCLVTFSVLSIASSNNDYSYSQKIADRTTAYYKASNQAELILSKIDASLLAAYRQSGTSALSNASCLPDDIEGLEVSEFPSVNYKVPINDTQELSVSLTIQIPEKSGDTFYRIQSWKEISTDDWNNDTTFHLMK